MRAQAGDLLPVLLAVTGVFMAWKALSLATNSPHPVIVVISESMSPAFHRGDVCFLSNRSASIKVGDIPVMWFQGQDLPMVHRAIESHWQDDDNATNGARQLILTKGDNNDIDDRSFYPPTQRYVKREQIVGVVVAYLPSIGWLPILFHQTMQKLFELLRQKLSVFGS